MMAGVVGAFLRRDFQVAVSYRLPFVLDALTTAFTVLTFSFIARLVRPGAVPGTYLVFVMAGLAVAALLQAGLTLVAGNVRQEQVQGTLEATLSTGVPVPLLAMGLTAYPLASAAARAALYVPLAALVGARAPGANWGLAVAAVALASVAFAGIGLAGAALVLLVRQAVAATTWLVAFLTLVSGVLFPVHLLPGWARVATEISPLTHALRLARGAILEGAAWGPSAGPLSALAGLSVLFAGVGVALLAASLSRARRTGGLGRY